MDIAIAVISMVIIIVLIAWLIMLPQKKVLKVSVPFFVVGFVLIYGVYLVALLQPDEPLLSTAVAFKAFVESYQSIASGADYSLLTSSDTLGSLASTTAFKTGFWFLHLLLFAMLTLSGFAVFGRRLMDAGRLAMVRLVNKRDVYHIFGDGESALQLGRNLAQECPAATIVFYSEEYQSGLREKISSFGGVLIEVSETNKAKYLQNAKDRWSGNIAVFSGLREDRVNGKSIADLLARKAVRDHAPYKSMVVRDSDAPLPPGGCFPEEPYCAIIVGFGQLGQSCARWLIETAQLSPQNVKPKIVIVDSNAIPFERFTIENPALDYCADIEFLHLDGFSFQFKDFLEHEYAQSGTLPKLFVCVSGVSSMNHEEREVNRSKDSLMVRHLSLILRRMGISQSGLAFAPNIENEDLWTREIILHQQLDALAVRLNGHYCMNNDEQLSPSERDKAYQAAWDNAAEYDKESSRASCDFMPAMLALAGVDPEADDAGAQFRQALEVDSALLENLARVEHRRWNAFHCVNGWVPMDRDELVRRVDALDRAKAEVAAGKAAEILPALRKPQRNAITKEHACIVSWEELPELDAVYARFDGQIAAGTDTLQKRDENSVDTLLELL